jgi:hypothetical protein
VIKRLVIFIVSMVSLMGCDDFSSVPIYNGISVEGMNYTPFNLTRFVIRDEYGNRAGGGGDLMPGAGEGSLSCCYKLRGTDFTVDWEIYDIDESEDVYAPLKKIHKQTKVHFQRTKSSVHPGTAVLAVHFYPDYHVELELRGDLGGSRINYSAVDYWFQKKYGKAANPEELDEFAAFRRTTRVAARGWMRYRLTDTVDLEQYVYYTLLVNPKFDEHPDVQRILKETKGRPGAFGAAMQMLPDTVVLEIKSNRFEHVQTGATHD